uniref:Uncharacterized protein n=1 Tax=Marseillevirus LCMAC101 TaxID=2506602 RepID=A0A481YS00_9VIRU|nr:MAG: hypothetical protein LCMAC101_04040 [Marseillevirus LCMAC101]
MRYKRFLILILKILDSTHTQFGCVCGRFFSQEFEKISDNFRKILGLSRKVRLLKTKVTYNKYKIKSYRNIFLNITFIFAKHVFGENTKLSKFRV